MSEEAYEKIKALADRYAENLKHKVDSRIEEMKSDDNEHRLIYRVLGISDEEGRLIDLYQNKGRFLYKYAGSFFGRSGGYVYKAKISFRRQNKSAKLINLTPKNI